MCGTGRNETMPESVSGRLLRGIASLAGKSIDGIKFVTFVFEENAGERRERVEQKKEGKKERKEGKETCRVFILSPSAF